MGPAPDVALATLRTWVLAMAGLLVLLLLALLGERAVSALAGTRRRRREAVLAPRVYEALQGSSGRGALPTLTRLDRAVVRGILLRLAEDLRGETGEALAALYCKLGLLELDLAALRSWRPSRRARAAVDLGLVGAGEALSGLTAALRDPDTRVRRAAVWSIGQLRDGSALPMLVPLLGDPSPLVAHRAQEVLAERGRDAEGAILRYADSTRDPGGRLAAIDLLGWLRVSRAAGLLLRLMNETEPEVRVKAVKAAAMLGDPRFLTSFQARLEDPVWEVRCQAAKGLSILGSPDSVPRLAVALRDAQWWVRFYAAAALAESGATGEAALSRALDDPEPRVRDMARYLLERGQLVPVLP